MLKWSQVGANAGVECVLTKTTISLLQGIHVLLEEVTNAGFVPGGTVDWDFFFVCTNFFFSLFQSLRILFIYLFLQQAEKAEEISRQLAVFTSRGMAARPLLINSPLNFNRSAINYWGLNVEIQLRCPTSVHKCLQRSFGTEQVEHLGSPSSLAAAAQPPTAKRETLYRFANIWVCHATDMETLMSTVLCSLF